MGQRKATITLITKGKNKGQFKYQLTADNGEPLDARETYHNLQDCKDTLVKYFPTFLIVVQEGKGGIGK